MKSALMRCVAAVMLMLTGLPAFAASHASAQSTSRTFPETGHSVRGRFLQYWDTHGGLAQQGYPITDELGEISATDGKTYTVQYFERAVFEYHPENQPPNDVLLSLLGVFRYKEKYPNGAPGQHLNTTPGARTFSETGHSIGGGFLQYWNTHGGLAQQGYPISDEFTEVSDLNGKPYTVQYFERAVFEYHPENPVASNVLLSQLGTFRNREQLTAGHRVAPPVQVPPALVVAGSPSVSRPAPTPTVPPKPAGSGKVIISSVYYDGQEYRTEGDEYAVIKNVGNVSVNLQGYTLNAGDSGQDFTFPSFVLPSGAEVRVYTNRDIAGSFSFGYRRAIWNNKGDCGYLYDPNGNEVSKYCY